MPDAPGTLLAGYCILAFLAAWAGGELPTRIKLTHTRLQVAVSFVAGLMLALSLLGLLPHAISSLPSAHQATGWALAGFMAMFLLQRFLPFHHHDVAEGSPLEPCGHTHSLAERSARNLGWIGVALGLSFHSILDGLAMAAATASATTTGAPDHSRTLGLGTALAVILHKPFGALAIATLMTARNISGPHRRLVILAFALVTPLGAQAFHFGAQSWASAHPSWLGAILAFCAGTFLCIASADLLPELQFHSHDRLKLTTALLAGIGVAVLIVRLAHGPTHSHSHSHPHPNPASTANPASPSAPAHFQP